MVSRSQFIESARYFLRVPFRHQGRTRAGLDCWGLIVVSCRRLGVDCPDDLHYQIRVNPALLKQGMEILGIEKPRLEILPGDLVLLHCGEMGFHSGIAGYWPSGLTIIASSRVIRRVSEKLLDLSVVAHVYKLRALQD